MKITMHNSSIQKTSQGWCTRFFDDEPGCWTMCHNSFFEAFKWFLDGVFVINKSKKKYIPPKD